MVCATHIKQKSLYTNNNTTPRRPENVLKCVEENSLSYLQEREGSNSKAHRRSNTQFIEDMKSNIYQQVEKLKEFKETRQDFHKVLHEKEQENDIMEKNFNKYKRNPLYEVEDEVSKDQSFFSKEQVNSDYLTEKPTIRKEYKKEEVVFDEMPGSLRRKYGDNHKYEKSMSCHFTMNNATDKKKEENKQIKQKINDFDDYNLNENKISNKFSSNKTSNNLYCQMKIQEKKSDIEEKISGLKQRILKGKKNIHFPMKDLYNFFEELNDCYQGFFLIFYLSFINNFIKDLTEMTDKLLSKNSYQNS